jgi:hypothetical protein
MLFVSLPLELNYKILEYYNWYQQQHQLIFQDTINQIKQFPVFIRKFKQRARRGFVIYYNFISNKGVHYITVRVKQNGTLYPYTVIDLRYFRLMTHLTVARFELTVEYF